MGHEIRQVPPGQIPVRWIPFPFGPGTAAGARRSVVARHVAGDFHIVPGMFTLAVWLVQHPERRLRQLLADMIRLRLVDPIAPSRMLTVGKITSESVKKKLEDLILVHLFHLCQQSHDPGFQLVCAEGTDLFQNPILCLICKPLILKSANQANCRFDNHVFVEARHASLLHSPSQPQWSPLFIGDGKSVLALSDKKWKCIGTSRRRK